MGAADDFRALLEPGAIRAVFQPIVRLSDLGTIGYEGLARFPTPPGLVALPPDVTLAAAARAGLRDDLEVACWSAIAAAGVPPHGRLLWVNLSPEALGHPGLLELAGKLPVAARDRAHRAGHGAQQRAAARAAAAVDRARRAGRGRRRGRRASRRWSTSPTSGPTSSSSRAGWSPASTATRPARPCCAPPPRSRARSARASWPRASSARRSSRRCARWRSTTARAGCSAARARRGRATPRPPRGPPAARRPAGGSSAISSARAPPRDASEAVVDHLARRGLLPAIYLAQDGRLRCQAVRGVWQVYDGLPASTGVVGRVFRTGVPAILDDVGESADYLPAIPGVRAEVCLPLRAAGQVVGVLDAESLTAIDAADAWRRSSAAPRCCRRGWTTSARSAPPRPPSGWPAPRSRLAVDRGPGGRRARGARRRARALGLRVRRRRPRRRPRRAVPAPRRGLLRASRSPSWPSEELAAMASWVDDGTSTYTVGDTAGRGFVGHEVLRRAGVGSLIVLPLTAAGERLGLIVVADRANRRPASEDVELLELLALQAANGLRLASMISQLRERVSRDPLTGLHASLPPLPERTGGRDARRRRPGRGQRRPRPGGGRRRAARRGRPAARADAAGLTGLPGRRRRVRGHDRPGARVSGRARRLGAALPGAGTVWAGPFRSASPSVGPARRARTSSARGVALDAVKQPAATACRSRRRSNTS